MEVLDIELGHVQAARPGHGNGQFPVSSDGRGREFLLKEGTDQRYGARHLKTGPSSERGLSRWQLAWPPIK